MYLSSQVFAFLCDLCAFARIIAVLRFIEFQRLEDIAALKAGGIYGKYYNKRRTERDLISPAGGRIIAA
jgi:hypothetical protein